MIYEVLVVDGCMRVWTNDVYNQSIDSDAVRSEGNYSSTIVNSSSYVENLYSAVVGQEIGDSTPTVFSLRTWHFTETTQKSNFNKEINNLLLIYI